MLVINSKECCNATINLLWPTPVYLQYCFPWSMPASLSKNAYEIQSGSKRRFPSCKPINKLLILRLLTKGGMRKGTHLREDAVCEEVSWRHWARAQEKAQAGDIWEWFTGAGLKPGDQVKHFLRNIKTVL